MERCTSEYRASTLAEPTTERGVWETGRIIVRTLEIEHEVMSRRAHETFEH
jgi:hypothetical protein